MAKQGLIPHGLPDATPCPLALIGNNAGSSTPPPNFTPAGIDPQPTADPLAIKTNEAEVPPPPSPPETPKTET